MVSPIRVSLISHTADPVTSIATAIACMKEKYPLEYVQNLPRKAKEEMIAELMKSKLIGALEFASFEFMVEGVTRAFTHQLVRHRTFHFSQQSLRFFDASISGFRMPEVSELCRSDIESAVQYTMHTYKNLVEAGCPTEDARSILPTNVLTLISFGATMRGLIDLAEVRLCYQTQQEFKEVMLAIKKEVTNVDPFLGSLLQVACERTGRCEFKSVYDRPCPKQKSL